MSKIRSFCSNAPIIVGVLLTGCLSTEGDLQLEGKIIDEYTKEVIPWRNVIVKGCIKSNEKELTIDAGQFSADSSGHFKHTLRKIKDVRYYNFILVGDSSYAFRIRNLGLYELEQNAKFLTFSASRLTDLYIMISRTSKKPDHDTLSLAWDSNDVFFWSLFPYRIYNYDKSNHLNSLPSGNELRWYGGYVNSTIKTRVFAEKRTKIYWDLDRYGKRLEFIDTITCRRNIVNRVYFSY